MCIRVGFTGTVNVYCFDWTVQWFPACAASAGTLWESNIQEKIVVNSAFCLCYVFWVCVLLMLVSERALFRVCACL